jgi:hypothetical protein
MPFFSKDSASSQPRFSHARYPEPVTTAHQYNQMNDARTLLARLAARPVAGLSRTA